MEYSFWGGFLLVLLMADPVGNIPIALACLKNVPNRRRLLVVARECAIAGAVLILSMFFGKPVMAELGLSDAALSIGGAVIVMLIAVRMVFPSKNGIFGETPDGEPLIVPLAIPAIAGPSTIATVIMLAAAQPGRMGEWALVIALTMAVCFVVLGAAEWVQRRLGPRVAMAIERLTGLILAMMATQMFLSGLDSYLKHAAAL